MDDKSHTNIWDPGSDLVLSANANIAWVCLEDVVQHERHRLTNGEYLVKLHVERP